MKKATIIGHFGFGLEYLDGQTIKTKIVAGELCRRFGDDEIVRIDTHGGIKTLFKAPFQAFKAMNNSRNVIMLPAHNGLRIYAPIISTFKKVFRDRKIHYVVIGGWLPEFLKIRKSLRKHLGCFDGIYVETHTMKKALGEQGLKNIIVMPNCKPLHILNESELIYHTAEPFPLCTFSRVMKEKGIEDAMKAVRTINEQFGRTVYTLDIYGQVDSNQTEWFEQLKKTFPDYIKYGGTVPFDRSTEVLKNYFALLFPTHFFTEGIPGTVIDAYAAGVPVISPMWESFSDLINNHKTGVGYDFSDLKGLEKILIDKISTPDDMNHMKQQCLEKASEYLPECVINELKRKMS